jgi:hypothetical protein
MGQTTQSVTIDLVDLGAGPMVLQVSSWLHAASARPKRLGDLTSLRPSLHAQAVRSSQEGALGASEHRARFG